MAGKQKLLHLLFLLLYFTGQTFGYAPVSSVSGSRSAITGRAVPGLHIMRRMITGYRSGSREASVTIVYRTRAEVKVRWFREADTKLPNSEVKDMLTIEGMNSYKVSSMRSGSVIANTLTIFNIPRSNYYTKYTTVFDFIEHPMQYMVDTHVDRQYDNYRDTNIDGMHYIRIPQPSMEFPSNGRFSVRCGLIMDSETKAYNEYLILNKNTYDTSSGEPFLDNEYLGSANEERGNYVDRFPRYVNRANRKLRGAGGKYKYEVAMIVTNATKEDQGMYICGAERANDRTYVSSLVTQVGRKTKPIVKLISCKDVKTKNKPNNRNNRRKQRPTTVRLAMSYNEETCYRCRAFGYPQPTVDVYRAGTAIRNDSTLIIDRHINVPDGGMTEVTYTYLRPTYQRHSGNYKCTAKNSEGTTSVEFRIDVQ